MTDTQNTYSVKLFISPQDVRRFIFSGSSFQALKEKILTITNLQDNRNIHVQLKYLDNEGDQVLLSSDSDLSYALNLSDKLLKIYLYTQTLISVPPWRQHHNYPQQNINYEHCKRVKEIDARFIRHETYQDNSEIAVGTNFQKSWVIRNTGTLKWPEGCYFLQIDRANDLNAPIRTPVDSINPNEEIILTVPMKAPNLTGLYQTYFKLCTSQGKKFGQRMRCQILTISDSIICPDRIDKVWEQLEAMGFISKGERSNEISTLILKENCDIPRIVRSLVNKYKRLSN
jgi:hypothetical protein